MIRWIVLLAVLSLSGCATDYRGYYQDDVQYVGGSSYYVAPSPDGYSDYGDYYYSTYSTGYRSPAYRYPLWMDYPYYYSLFWPLQRWTYDPYWHSGFYYGVTYFPRNYFALDLYSSRHRYWGHDPYWGIGLAYSPYRLSWVDAYYDWYPYHDRYHHRPHWHYAPRYGNARHESERLAQHWRAGERYDGGHRGAHYDSRQRAGLPRSERYGQGYRSVPANPERDASYRGRPADRLDPGVRAFDQRQQTRRLDSRLTPEQQVRRRALHDDSGARDGTRNEIRQLGIQRERPLREPEWSARRPIEQPSQPQVQRGWAGHEPARQREAYQAHDSQRREAASSRREGYRIDGLQSRGPLPARERAAAAEPRGYRSEVPARRAYVEPYRTPPTRDSAPPSRAEISGYRSAPSPAVAPRVVDYGRTSPAPSYRAPAPVYEAPAREERSESRSDSRSEVRSESSRRGESRHDDSRHDHQRR